MKDVTLSRSAWHVKFFMWATSKSAYDKWNNLCPYFWSVLPLLIIFPLILVWKLLKAIVKGIILLFKLIPKSKKVEKEYVYKEPSEKSIKAMKVLNATGKWFGRIFIGLYLGFALFAIVRGLYLLFSSEGAVMGLVYIFSFIGLFACLIAIIWGLISYFTSDTHEMIKAMIHAKKNKYCPHITWVD